MALQLLDSLLAQLSLDVNNNHIFTDAFFPKLVLNRIWSYLIDEAPLDDGITLTCCAFRNITYKHPSHASRFHFRLEPNFRFTNFQTNHNKFQIGFNATPAMKRAIIVQNIKDAITSNPNHPFPFHSLKVFNVTNSCKLKDIVPFFREFGNSIKFMSWNSCKFLNQNYNKVKSSLDDIEQKEWGNDAIDRPFTKCTLFSLLTRTRWDPSINLNGKFPQLLCFSYTIEWYNHFDLIQQFLDSHSSTISILFLDFNFNLPSSIRSKWDLNALNGHPTRLYLKLPQNIEICVLSAVNKETSSYIDIDFSLCRHKIKQLVCLNNSFSMTLSMFIDGKGNNSLKYLVINDIDGVHQIPWKQLNIGNNKLNKLENIYVPCTPEFASKISDKCIGEFPNLEQVKNIIENIGARKVLRDLNCEQRRHWLWGLFWFERRGIGMKKLKILENKWKKQQSVEYF